MELGACMPSSGSLGAWPALVEPPPAKSPSNLTYIPQRDPGLAQCKLKLSSIGRSLVRVA